VDYAERIVKGHPRTEGMVRTLAGAALCAAVFVSGPVGPNIAPVAPEVTTVKPNHEDDCVPTGVVKTPSGAVYGEEDCPGPNLKRHTRMDKK
jgi:hypothetical protein